MCDEIVVLFASDVLALVVVVVVALIFVKFDELRALSCPGLCRSCGVDFGLVRQCTGAVLAQARS
jgi:hypothetical protein